ncbi:MAG TPA: glucose-6-phosphate dehydrogenase assembly protein OpcA [Pyrinomonadaceae bacterium]|nr:glucose-6-phosphate dehydrogenase assembly protein OpcA [Pyrinomonadaceae bacterium]
METQKQTSVATAGVDVARLERELAAMWRESAAGGDGGGGASEAGVTRVCVANLIVYAPRSEGREVIDAMLDEVTEQTPTRAVVLLADTQSQETALDAYVSTRCQAAPRGGKQVCGEQVTIEAAGGALDHLATAAEPLLVPDIPTFLWWKDIPHYEDKLFTRVVELCERVVIDSAAFDHPREDLLRVARLVEEHPRLALSDLNWGRLTTLRNVLADFWDVADYREHLDRPDAVEIEFAPPAAAPGQTSAQALLLAGWLASRLGWELVSAGGAADGGGGSFRLRSAGREFDLRLVVAEGVEESAGVTVRRVTLKREGGAAEFQARMSRDWTKLETTARVGQAHEVSRVLPYEARTEGQRLSRELALLSRDRAYEEAAAYAARLIVGTS